MTGPHSRGSGGGGLLVPLPAASAWLEDACGGFGPSPEVQQLCPGTQSYAGWGDGAMQAWLHNIVVLNLGRRACLLVVSQVGSCGLKVHVHDDACMHAPP